MKEVEILKLFLKIKTLASDDESSIDELKEAIDLLCDFEPTKKMRLKVNTS